MAGDRSTEVDRGAQQGLEEKGGAELARALLRDEPAAVLATTLASSGHPFASLVPFALSRPRLRSVGQQYQRGRWSAEARRR